jgi:hypothetical protein
MRVGPSNVLYAANWQVEIAPHENFLKDKIISKNPSCDRNGAEGAFKGAKWCIIRQPF